MGFDCLQEKVIFLFSKIPRLAFRPTQSSVQWVLPVLFLGVKWQQLEVSHLPLSSAKVKNVWSCISALPCAFVACKGTTFFFLRCFMARFYCSYSFMDRIQM
jgi:hypothetical protein